MRPLRTHRELDACVCLQREIWGPEYGDIVPASILKVSQSVGGVAIGAFVNRDEPVGFVFGMTGVRESRLTHWSHMLGVLRAHRGRGIGRRLKLLQREWLLERGVTEMRWTFDPLISGNAHFNLNLLGVEIRRYVPEMYGDTGSALHSFGTDRFVVRWDLSKPLASDGSTPAGSVAWEQAPVLASDRSEKGVESVAPGPRPQALRIEIPYDILGVNRADPTEATAWRRATRRAFLDSWRAGYRVAGFTRSKAEARCHYLLLSEDGARE